MAIQIAEGIILAMLGLIAILLTVGVLAKAAAWRPTQKGSRNVRPSYSRNKGERLIGKIILVLGVICVVIWTALFAFGDRLGK